MSRLSNLKESLTQLTHTHPQLARDLLNVDKERVKRHFEFCNTEKNELNLIYKKGTQTITFHAPSGAIQECSSWLAPIEPKCQVLYVFGVGLGYSFLTFRRWLAEDPNLHIVYIEPLLEVLFHLFQTDLGKKIVFHPRVHIYHFKKKKHLKQLMDHLSCEFSFYKAKAISSVLYQKNYPLISSFISQALPHQQQELSSLIKESQHSYKNFFRNFTQLAPHMNGRYNGSGLVDAFKDIPCIIVGAGPSLQKNIHILKTLQDKAIIMAGSSAISGLTQQGINPHFGHYFDPYLRLHSRFLTNTAFELPTFHCARTFSEVSRWIHGPQLYLKGSIATPIVNWLEDQLGFRGVQDQELISVTASNTFIAQLMGCNPIVYVGVDLAYTDNKNYMQGVVKEAEAIENVAAKESTEFVFNQDEMSTDIHGNPVKTRYGWIVESQMIANLAHTTPYIRFINATEGGLGFQNISNLPLEKVADWFIKRRYPIEEMIHAQITPQRIESKNHSRKALEILKEVLASLKRCNQHYYAAVKSLKSQLKANKSGHLKEIDPQCIIESMTRVGQEIAYQYLMKRYHQIIDIPKLKNKFLLKNLNANSSLTLTHQIKLKDMVLRFNDYYIIGKELQFILQNSIKNAKEEPW